MVAARIGPHPVVEQDRSRRIAIDGDEDGEGDRRGRHAAAPRGSMPDRRRGATHAALPSATVRPPTLPSIPHPGDLADGSSGGSIGKITFRAARTTAAANTCGDIWSSEAASRKQSREPGGGAHRRPRRRPPVDRPSACPSCRTGGSPRPASRFEGGAVLHDDAVTGRSRERPTRWRPAPRGSRGMVWPSRARPPPATRSPERPARRGRR